MANCLNSNKLLPYKLNGTDKTSQAGGQTRAWTWSFHTTSAQSRHSNTNWEEQKCKHLQIVLPTKQTTSSAIIQKLHTLGPNLRRIIIALICIAAWSKLCLYQHQLLMKKMSFSSCSPSFDVSLHILFLSMIPFPLICIFQTHFQT